MTTPTAAPQFHLPRSSTWRDLAIVAVCVTIIGGFLAQVWRAPAPDQVRTLAAPTSLDVRA